MSLKDEIIAARDSKREPLDVPEWGLRVWIRTITSVEQDSLADELYANGRKPGMAELKTRTLALALVNEEGERVFTDAEAAALNDKNAIAVQRCYDKFEELQGYGSQTRKNSAAGAGGASS